MMGCNEIVRELQKDFCSAFSNSKEFYQKLFTLTPQDLTKDEYLAYGNKWIVHFKGLYFKDIDKIYIYEADDFIAFRRDYKPSAAHKQKVGLMIFHKKIAPDAIELGFTTKNELLINQILQTIN